jgi:hypothetical protein
MMAMLSFSTIGGLSAHLSSCKKIRQNIAASNNRDQQSYSASMQGSYGMRAFARGGLLNR